MEVGPKEPRKGRDGDEAAASSPRAGLGLGGKGLGLLRGDRRRSGFLFAIGFHERAQDPLHDSDLAVHRHEAVERAGPVLLRSVVAVGKDREVTSRGQDRIGCELQVDGELGWKPRTLTDGVRDTFRLEGR